MSTIGVSEIRAARFFPEILPCTVIRNIGASSYASPEPLDLRRFGVDRFVQLRDLYIDTDSEVRYNLVGDDFSIERNAGATDDEPMDTIISAMNSLSFSLFNENTGAPKNDFRTYFGVLVDKPTVAQKLKFDYELTTEQEEINEDLSIENSVNKGVLPLPYTYKYEREYQIIDSYVVSTRISDVPTVGDGAVFEDFTVKPGEALILSAIACDPETVADNLRIVIDRDNDFGYITFHPSVINDRNINMSCWIPAIRELRFRALAGAAVTDVDVRLILKRVVLTDLLKARWNLIEEAPGDLIRKVDGGVL